MGKIRSSLSERFWRKVQKAGDNDCWPWTGTTRADKGFKYGLLWNGGPKKTMLRAHRVSYELHHGEIPDGMEICHKCDNPICVNPAHLFAGTHGDNVRDMHGKGRWKCKDRRGERNNRAKLTAKDVGEIREMRNAGMTQQSIADRFGVSQPMIGYILRGDNWKHL